MRKLLFLAIFATLLTDVQAQEFKVITIVESIVPMGLGRSRMIEHHDQVDHNKFTTGREDGQDSKQKNVKRKDLKIENLSETKMLNFYSGVGINFQNIASNDAIVSSKINAMLAEGWELKFVNGGVESHAGKGDNAGIFITRLFFSKN